MTLILTLSVLAFLTYAAWQDRTQLEDEWTAFARELGL